MYNGGIICVQDQSMVQMSVTWSRDGHAYYCDFADMTTAKSCHRWPEGQRCCRFPHTHISQFYTRPSTPAARLKKARPHLFSLTSCLTHAGSGSRLRAGLNCLEPRCRAHVSVGCLDAELARKHFAVARSTFHWQGLPLHTHIEYNDQMQHPAR